MPGDEKLLERMRRSKSGFGSKDLDALYASFGFKYREGRDRFWYHPKYPWLWANVARHNELAKGYVAHAVKIIDQLKELEGRDEQDRRSSHE